MKKIFFYIETYVSNFPCYLAHEISHIIFVFIFWIFGINSFPKMIWKRKASMTINKDLTTSMQSTYLFVQYTSYFKNRIPLLIVSASPALLTILLFIFSPWYMYLYYIANINTLWMSVGDTVKCQEIFIAYRRAIRIRWHSGHTIVGRIFSTK